MEYNTTDTLPNINGLSSQKIIAVKAGEFEIKADTGNAYIDYLVVFSVIVAVLLYKLISLKYKK